MISTSSSVLNKVKEIDRKLDELREFLEDVFLTPEEYRLLREVDNIVKEKKLSELTPMKFKVLLHRKVESVLGRLDANIRKRIAERLRELEDFPGTKLDILKTAGKVYQP